MPRITQLLRFVESLWALGEATAGLNDQAAAATSFHLMMYPAEVDVVSAAKLCVLLRLFAVVWWAWRAGSAVLPWFCPGSAL